MRKKDYILPELTLHYYDVEQGFGASQGSPDVNIGIGGWEADAEDYGGNLK
jgi:hypothetical protein